MGCISRFNFSFQSSASRLLCDIDRRNFSNLLVPDVGKITIPASTEGYRRSLAREVKDFIPVFVYPAGAAQRIESGRRLAPSVTGRFAPSSPLTGVAAVWPNLRT